MGGIAAGVGGALLGGVGGALSNQKTGARDAGNVYSDNIGGVGGASNQVTQGVQGYQNLNNANATSDVQNNGILGQYFGQNGLLSDTMNQEKDLANNGFNLTDTDKTAYGEAAGNIARQFGQNDASLSQALSDRGLSSSGVAGQAFSNSLGNKNEQLAGLQTQIAQNRMQMNQQRLAQTQNFLGQLGQQGQNAIGQAFGQRQQQSSDLYNSGMGQLGAIQGQANEQLSQQQGTQHGSDLSNAFSGGIAGVGAGMSVGNSLSSMNNNNAQAKFYGSMTPSSPS